MPDQLFNWLAGQRRNLLNMIFFQCGWFACLMGGDAIALGATLLVVFLHWWLISRAKQEWRFIALVTLLGLLIDSLLSVAGVFIFTQASLGFIPLWLLCIWVLFATTLWHSLSWLKSYVWLAALLGAASGPLAYFTGSQLASVTLMQPTVLALVILGVIWGCLLPGLFWLMRSLSCFAWRG